MKPRKVSHEIPFRDTQAVVTGRYTAATPGTRLDPPDPAEFELHSVAVNGKRIDPDSLTDDEAELLTERMIEICSEDDSYAAWDEDHGGSVSRRVRWFSGGAASAVATKLDLVAHRGRGQVTTKQAAVSEIVLMAKAIIGCCQRSRRAPNVFEAIERCATNIIVAVSDSGLSTNVDEASTRNGEPHDQ